MIQTGILNPHVLSLLARVRHTNTLVIADRGFPSWRDVETIDLSLIDDVPTVVQVILALRPIFQIAQAWMAEEFVHENTAEVRQQFAEALRRRADRSRNARAAEARVPAATGLIRTGDTIQYGNVILESG